MDTFRKLLDKCGVGGIKCKCCRPTKRNKKDRKHNRAARRVLKQFLVNDTNK